MLAIICLGIFFVLFFGLFFLLRNFFPRLLLIICQFVSLIPFLNQETSGNIYVPCVMLGKKDAISNEPLHFP